MPRAGDSRVDLGKAISFYESGENLAMVGTRFGVKQNTLAGFFKKHGYKVRSVSQARTGIKVPAAEAAPDMRVFLLHAHGYSSGQIGRVLGKSRTYADKHMKKLKLAPNFERGRGQVSATREDHGNWKGGMFKSDGYVHLLCGSGDTKKYEREHVLVVEASIGRKLVSFGTNHPESETVHHINGNKSDNRIENLAVLTRREHSRLHATKMHAERRGCLR